MERRSMVDRGPPGPRPAIVSDPVVRERDGAFVGRAAQPAIAPGEEPPFDPSTDNLGRPLLNLSYRLHSGAGIAVEYGGLDATLRLDIGPLAVAEGQPTQQWVPIWNEGTPYNAIRRVPVSAIPVDAPKDHVVYGRQDGSWVPAIENVTIGWDDITNKPTTFPPTLPIPQSGVTDLDTRLATIEGVNTGQDARLGSIESKNASQDTRLDGVESTNTQQDAAIAANSASLATKIGAPPTTPSQSWVMNSTGSWVKDPIQTDPPNDGAQYARKGDGTWVKVTGGVFLADTPPAGAPDSSLWVESDSGALFVRWNDGNSTQWVMLNAAGMPEAPINANAYLRSAGGWVSGGTIAGTLTMGPGATLYGELAVFSRNLADGYCGIFDNKNTANGAGGVLGQTNNGNTWGIVGYIIGGVGYSFYGNAGVYCTTVTATANVNANNSVNAPYLSGTSYVTANNGYFTTNGYLSVANSAQTAQYAIAGSGSGAGGVLGYTPGNAQYGVVGFPGYTFYGAGAAHIYNGGADVRAGDYLRSMGQTAILVGHPTTTAAATGYLNTGGTVYRSTSSAAFKTAIEPMADEYADKILQLKPIFYRPNEKTDDDPTWSRFGFSAEDAHAVDFRFAVVDRKVQRTPDGKKAQFATKAGVQPNPEHIAWTALPVAERPEPMPEPYILWDEPTGEAIFLDGMEPVNVDLNAIVAGLVQLVQRQNARIQTLEARLGL